ncbi:olfactory receptor 52E8-like [Garra rufa]|uniref:olfactory receptor 52E8-like n=1 Tax=Garra rufa TaxID=137080 RepID=UPI003CCE705F
MIYPVILTLMVPKETKTYRHLYFTCFLTLCLFILPVNIRLVMVIIMEKALHEPMYIFLCHMCINGVYGASGFYPKILSDLILDSYVISHMCTLQTFVIYSSLLCDFTILTVMAYDRYVAICKPLEYHSKLTKNTFELKLIMFSWIVPNFSVIPAALLSNLRPFCKYHIDKLYCDNWSIVKLSCLSRFVNNVFGYANGVLYSCCIIFIIVSYIKLISACKLSLENKRKFWQTGLPHVLSLINFTIAMFFDVMYSRYGANDIPESLRNFLALELVIVPPVFNPLIYGLNIRAVRKRVFILRYSKRMSFEAASAARFEFIYACLVAVDVRSAETARRRPCFVEGVEVLFRGEVATTAISVPASDISVPHAATSAISEPDNQVVVPQGLAIHSIVMCCYSKIHVWAQEPAVCQCIHAEGSLGKGVVQLAVGGRAALFPVDLNPQLAEVLEYQIPVIAQLFL